MQKIGELFILGFHGPIVPRWLEEFAGKYGLGGVILFDYDLQKQRYENNVTSPFQLKRLCHDLSRLKSGPLIFVDQEGGKVRRLKEKLGFAPLPSAKAFAQLPPEEKTKIARESFREMRMTGIHFNLAPVVDLDLNPLNPDIGKIERAFARDLKTVKANAEILDLVAKEVGLGLCLKHYPGLGGAKTNSHLELTDISDSVSEEQLSLFESLGQTISGQAVLVSHGFVKQWDANLPISMSEKGLRRLREKLPQALLISDDLQMQGLQRRLSSEAATLQGLDAGLDLVILGNNLLDESANIGKFAEAVKVRCQSHPLFHAKVRTAIHRVALRKKQFKAIS